MDNEGFLLDRDDWSEAVAAQLVHKDGYDMTSEFMGFIEQARKMYSEAGVVPPIRQESRYR